ncbi:MAG: hypothetical protein J1F16_01335 [Muribaculaceae bacterium]|nr:hypothetical protein [Muribaculaceae bacterium]
MKKYLGKILIAVFFCIMAVVYLCNKDQKEEIKEPKDTDMLFTYRYNVIESEQEIYDYRLTITDADELLRTSNIQRGWRDEPPLKMTSSQIKALNGVYEWQSTIAFKTQREMFDYICEHFSEMQKFKVSAAPTSQKSVNSSNYTNIYDEYQNRLDDYLDDPEDEITFDPDIFDFQDV